MCKISEASFLSTFLYMYVNPVKVIDTISVNYSEYTEMSHAFQY